MEKTVTVIITMKEIMDGMANGPWDLEIWEDMDLEMALNQLDGVG